MKKTRKENFDAADEKISTGKPVAISNVNGLFYVDNKTNTAFGNLDTDVPETVVEKARAFARKRGLTF